MPRRPDGQCAVMERVGTSPALPPAPAASESELAHLVLMATYAPSVHNTQPWQFETLSDGLLLRADRSRQLAVTDPYGRDLAMSCGAAVHHLQVAARAIGLDTEVTLFPHDGEPDDLAHVRVLRGAPATEPEVEAAVAILHRHTHRGRFPSEQVSGELVEQLRAAVELQHGMLRVVHPDELVEVEVLVSLSEQTLLQTSGYAAELNQWVWTAGQDGPRPDGLPADAVDHGVDRAESLQGRQFVGTGPERSGEPPVPEHPTVVLLTTLADEPGDWVQAGRALSALLLAATAGHALAQPIGQVVDVPQTRWAIQRLLGTVGIPQMLLRLGSGDSLPQTPRRAVGDVRVPAP